MNILVNSIIQDPSAIAEFLAAPLTALYILKLNINTTAALRETSSPRNFNAGQCINKKHLSFKDNRQNLLREKLLKTFSVGQLISTSKKSLRKQFLSRFI